MGLLFTSWGAFISGLCSAGLTSVITHSHCEVFYDNEDHGDANNNDSSSSSSREHSEMDDRPTVSGRGLEDQHTALAHCHPRCKL